MRQGFESSTKLCYNPRLGTKEEGLQTDESELESAPRGVEGSCQLESVLEIDEGSASRDQVEGNADSRGEIETSSQKKCPDPEGTSVNITGL